MNPALNSPHFDTPHLDEDQMDEVLMDAGSPATIAHLTACDPCTQRFAAFKSEFESQMAVFNQATSAWSQARSNTISRDLLAHKPAPRLTLSALASAAVALLLIVGLGLNAGFRPAAETPAPTEQAAATPVDQVDSDNAMLAAIDSAIVTPRPDRFGLYEETSTRVRATRQSARSGVAADSPQVVE